jgi:hypothetical protein
VISLLQAIHVTEQRLSDQMSGHVKWFVGILFVQDPGKPHWLVCRLTFATPIEWT